MPAIVVSLGLALLLTGGATSAVAGAEPSSDSGSIAVPTPSISPAEIPNVGRPLTTDELLTAWVDLSPAGLPVALVAEASIDLDPGWRMPPCDRAVCPLGALVTTDGTMPVVDADRTVRDLYQRSRRSIAGVLAFELSPGQLRFLGRVVLHPDGSLTQPAGPDMMAWADQLNAGELMAVDGWLGVLGWGVPCPPPPPELMADGDPDESPFVRCPAGWITADATLPEQAPDRVVMTPPGFAIAVQASAYGRYAPEPGEVEAFMVPPRRGIYLLRHVGVNMGRPTGWQVVGRLDPAVMRGGGLPAPSAEPSPSLWPALGYSRSRAVVPR